MTFKDYIDMLIQRKKTVIAITAAVFLLTGIILAVMPRTYEGESTLLFPQQMTSSLGSLAQLTDLPLFGGLQGLSGRDVYITILKSRTISENVCSKLRLGKYDLDYEDLQENLILETPKEGGLILTFKVPTSWLRGHMPRRQLKRQTASLAARVANAYVAELDIFDNSNALSMGRKNRLFIEKQLERTKIELADAEVRLQKFQEAHPTLVPPDDSSKYADQALEIVTQRTQAEVALQETGNQLTRAHAIWKNGAPQNISPEAVINSPAIDGLKQKLAELEVKRATLLVDYTETHPEVVSLTQEIEKTYEGIHSEVARVVSGKASSASPAHQELLKQLVLLEINNEGVQARKSALAGALSDIEHQLGNLPSKEVGYARLLRQVKVNETVYTTLLAEHAKARVAEGREMDNFVVLDRAVPEEKPASPRVKLTLAAALVIGFILGVMAATIQAGSTGKQPA